MHIRSKPYRRTRILVDRHLQWSLCLHGVVYGALLLLIVSGGIFAPLLWNLSDRAPNAPYDPEIATVMLYMHHRFWLVAGAGLVLVMLGSLRFSHRIAGPLVRFKRNLRLLAEGQLPPKLRTRNGDFMQEEVSCLNSAVLGIGTRIEAVRAAQSSLRRELEAVADAARSGAREVDLEAVLGANRELESRLDEFSTIADLDGYAIVPQAPLELQPAGVGAGIDDEGAVR